MEWRTAALVVVVTTALAPRQAVCKCVGPSTAREAFDNSDLVFEGRAVERHATQISICRDTFKADCYFPAWSYGMVVERQWKGEIRPRQRVAFGLLPCMGGQYLRGERVMVYASRQDDGQYETSRCDNPLQPGIEGLGPPIYVAATQPPSAVDSEVGGWPTGYYPEILSPERVAAERTQTIHTACDVALMALGLSLAVAGLWRRRDQPR